MKRLSKRCCSFILGAVLTCGLFPASVHAAGDNKQTPSGLTAQELEKQIDSYVEKYVGKSIPGAVVIVTKDQELLLNKAYGYKDPVAKTEITTKDTTFELGSLSKLYTYTAVMQQVETGKVNLDEDIFAYFPEEFSKKLNSHLISDKSITVMNLINNTAGFEEKGVDIAVSDPKYLDATLREALEKTMPDQVYEPGEVMTGASYSSALLGYIVECVTDMPFSSYVKENIYQPLGASDSIFMADTTKDKRINDAKATPYGRGSEGQFRKVEDLYSNLYPAAGALTTGDDLAKFLQSYLPKKGVDGSLLKGQTIQGMLKKAYAINENAKGQCIGFYQYPSDEIKAYYHDGSSNGYSSMMTIAPEEGVGVAVLTNSAISGEFLYGLTNLVLVGDKEEESIVPESQEGFPEASDFTGITFVGAKRAYCNIMKFTGYFGNCTSFRAGENGTLVIDSKEYKQIKPYVFEYVESMDQDKNTVLEKTIAKYIYFGHDETGKVTKWSYGGSGTAEFVATDNTWIQSYLTLGMFAIMIGGLLSAVLFSTSLILSALDYVHKKKLLHSPRIAFRISVILFVGLECNVVNELTKLVGNQLVASREIFWNMIASYGLSGAILLSFVYFLYCCKKETLKLGRALFYGIVYAFMGGFVSLMFVWKFFAIL